MRIREATRNITTIMQQNETNAENNNNNKEMDHHASPPPPEEKPPDEMEAGRIVAIDIEFRSGLGSECHAMSSTR